mmetsp:Transcript_12362/g.23164  ORF Transcript_12362/g.23164 Transcript_12362/m.23164 type:complete len:458 (+) Transcript_12362:70-1443(+)
MNVKIQKRKRKTIWAKKSRVSILSCSVQLVSAAGARGGSLILLFFFYSSFSSWHFFQQNSNSRHSKAVTETFTQNSNSYQNPGSQSLIWIAGLVLDNHAMEITVKDTLIELNCRHRVGIHVLLKSEHQIIPFYKEWQQKQLLFLNHTAYEDVKIGNSCGPVLIQDQISLMKDTDIQSEWLSYSTSPNRIDKISALRDLQRSILYKILVEQHVSSHYSSSYSKLNQEGIVVIIVDMDLHKIPDTAQIMKQVYLLQDIQYPFDAICTAGITMNIGGNLRTDKKGSTLSRRIYERIPSYYDTFATVFLPDTFSHPIKRRLIPYMYNGEDPKLIRSDNQYGNFTQADIFQYFVNTHQGKPVGVKSCFGGMAMYRAHIYFDDQCKYSLDNITLQEFQDILQKQSDEYFRQGLHQGDIFRYANNKEQRPCEHVVFHDCLKRVNKSDFRIAVNPALKTYWKRDF